MYEEITQIAISVVTAIVLLIGIIWKNLKSETGLIKVAITEIRTVLFKEYATKTEVNTSVDRIITQLNRIENKLDHKKDK